MEGIRDQSAFNWVAERTNRQLQLAAKSGSWLFAQLGKMTFGPHSPALPDFSSGFQHSKYFWGRQTSIKRQNTPLPQTKFHCWSLAGAEGKEGSFVNLIAKLEMRFKILSGLH